MGVMFIKKLPNIYKNQLSKKIKNNKTVFDSLKDEVKPIENKEINLSYNKLTVREKIQELINQNSYIFNTKVSLILGDTEKVCKIAGVVNNHIITMDNEIIKIEDVKDIEILK